MCLFSCKIGSRTRTARRRRRTQVIRSTSGSCSENNCRESSNRCGSEIACHKEAGKDVDGSRDMIRRDRKQYIQKPMFVSQSVFNDDVVREKSK